MNIDELNTLHNHRSTTIGDCPYSERWAVNRQCYRWTSQSIIWPVARRWFGYNRNRSVGVKEANTNYSPVKRGESRLCTLIKYASSTFLRRFSRLSLSLSLFFLSSYYTNVRCFFTLFFQESFDQRLSVLLWAVNSLFFGVDHSSEIVFTVSTKVQPNCLYHF